MGVLALGGPESHRIPVAKFNLISYLEPCVLLNLPQVSFCCHFKRVVPPLLSYLLNFTIQVKFGQRIIIGNMVFSDYRFKSLEPGSTIVFLHFVSSRLNEVRVMLHTDGSLHPQ
jgi:hypothetical protein